MAYDGRLLVGMNIPLRLVTKGLLGSEEGYKLVGIKEVNTGRRKAVTILDR